MKPLTALLLLSLLAGCGKKVETPCAHVWLKIVFGNTTQDLMKAKEKGEGLLISSDSLGEGWIQNSLRN